jgi:hypothetical protein
MIFIDYNKKRVFILAAKCGNHTISDYLNCGLQGSFDQTEISSALGNKDFKKIFVIRNPYVRFLSGFYEDLGNNDCYNNIDVSFKQYVQFLYYCHCNKIANVNNLNVYFPNNNQEIYWGGNLDLQLPITDVNGTITGHIEKQTQFIKFFFDLFQIKDIKVIDVCELSDTLGLKSSSEIKNTKTYTLGNVTNQIKLSDLKKNPELRVNHKLLYDKEIISILDVIYKDDFDFIKYLNRNGYNFNYEI